VKIDGELCRVVILWGTLGAVQKFWLFPNCWGNTSRTRWMRAWTCSWICSGGVGIGMVDVTPGTQTIQTLVLMVSWVIKRWIRISSSISLPGSVSMTMVFVLVLERNEVMFCEVVGGGWEGGRGFNFYSVDLCCFD